MLAFLFRLTFCLTCMSVLPAYIYVSGAHRDQKRMLDFQTGEIQIVEWHCWCWEPNSGLLKKQPSLYHWALSLGVPPSACWKALVLAGLRLPLESKMILNFRFSCLHQVLVIQACGLGLGLWPYVFLPRLNSSCSDFFLLCFYSFSYWHVKIPCILLASTLLNKHCKYPFRLWIGSEKAASCSKC